MADAFTSLDLATSPHEAILTAAPPLIELLPMAVFACGLGGRLCWFNSQAAEILERAPAIGEDCFGLFGLPQIYAFDGTLVEQEESPLALVLRTGEAVSNRSVSVERADGSRRAAAADIGPLKDEAGNLIGAIACFRDVTADLREDRATRESERHLRALLQALPAAIYTTDAQGRITFYNEAAVEMSGRRPVLGQDEWCVTWKLYAPDGTPLPHDQCPMAVALKEDRPIRGVEAVAERPDGSRIPFLPFPTPLHDFVGNLIGAVNMLVDISHRKDAETQQRLVFSELNHRIKNNMQMLHALLAAARRETHSEEARVALDDAARRVGSMAAAQTVLYQTNNLNRFNPSHFMESVCTSAASACGERVNIACGSSVRELPNDTAVPLALILNELITNAAKHGVGAQGAGSVRVELGEKEGVFTLTVADDGPGFDLTDVSRRSSGLGLVMGLARQIGGSLNVERDGGARCTISFRDQSRG